MATNQPTHALLIAITSGYYRPIGFDLRSARTTSPSAHKASIGGVQPPMDVLALLTTPTQTIIGTRGLTERSVAW
jgi:hypothetical protein